MARFDPAAATAAYLAQLPPEAHAKAQAYTQGGHWLLLWGCLVTLVVASLVLRSGVLPAVRDRLERRWPRPVSTPFILSLIYFAASWALSLPWDIYSRWWRERSYGFSSQSLPAWLGEGVMATAIGAFVGGVFLIALYALIRRAQRVWWAWAGGLTAVFILFILLIQPVLIDPIFNSYTPAPAGPVREAVVEIAKASSVRPDRIFVYDGSKQSNLYTANVAGLFGTARIAMSDVMFQSGADVPEVRGVVGHEMGHYVHLHAVWLTLGYSLIAMLVFWLIDRLFGPAARLLGARGVRGLDDPAGMPVLAALATVLMLAATPAVNTLSRCVEADADTFSLQHVDEPDGLARALVKTIAYRAAAPSWLEETVFYDHPAVARRIRKAMDWKASHNLARR